MTPEEKNYVYYGDFDWIDYYNKNNNKFKEKKMESKSEIYCEYIKEEKTKKNPIYFDILNVNNNTNHDCFFTFNDIKVTYDDFPWESYITINYDLKGKGIDTKEKAWNHWIHNGKKEERAFSLINNTNNHRGRLGNIFFVNMCLHFLSLKYNLKCNYKFSKKFEKMGISFHCGEKTYGKNLLITESNYLSILDSTDYEPSNIIIYNKVWFQSELFCLQIKKYFDKKVNKDKVIMNNVFKKRYNDNNDLFIHVRLGDIINKTDFLLPYYEKMLNNIYYNKGYISSDSINSEFCKNLIKKYKLEVIDLKEIETIMFGSTCKHIVLSGGTFSWLIGFFAFYAHDIYYPKIEKRWFGKIFNFSNWICVSDY
jgi:hypothetical protein